MQQFPFFPPNFSNDPYIPKYSQARQLMNDQNYKQAIPLLKECFKMLEADEQQNGMDSELMDTFGDVLVCLSKCYSNLKDLKQAAKFAKDALTKNPNYAPATEQRGLILVIKGKFSKALVFYKEALKQKHRLHDVALTYVSVVACLFNMKKFDEALKYAQLARQVCKPQQQPEVYLHMAKCYLRLEQYDNALNALHQKHTHVDQHTRFVNLWTKAQVYSRMKKYNESLACYEQTVLMLQYANSLDRYNVLKERLELYHIVQDHAKCIAKSDEVIALAPNKIDGYLLRCMSNIELENYTAMIPDCKKLLQLNPKEERAFFYLGIAQCALGQLDDGIKALEQSCQLNKIHPDSKDCLEQAQEAKSEGKSRVEWDLKMHKRESKRWAAPTTTCTNCGKQSKSLKQCSRCKTSYYCNTDCQTQHWPVHKQFCKK